MTSFFPFLSLPPEVRLQIYAYLIPNIPIFNFSLIRNKHPPLRTDGKSCSPAILRTNHAIYAEAIREWYSATVYEILVDAKYTLFCGKILHPSARFPSTLRHVSSIHLYIALQRSPHRLTYSDAPLISHLVHFHGRLETLARELGNPAGRRLRCLHIEIAVDVPLVLSLTKTRADLVELLRWNLDPIRENVRGVRVVCFEVKEQSYGIKSREFLAACGELRTVMYRFLEEMRQEMCL